MSKTIPDQQSDPLLAAHTPDRAPQNINRTLLGSPASLRNADVDTSCQVLDLRHSRSRDRALGLSATFRTDPMAIEYLCLQFSMACSRPFAQPLNPSPLTGEGEGETYPPPSNSFPPGEVELLGLVDPYHRASLNRSAVPLDLFSRISAYTVPEMSRYFVKGHKPCPYISTAEPGGGQL